MLQVPQRMPYTVQKQQQYVGGDGQQLCRRIISINKASVCCFAGAAVVGPFLSPLDRQAYFSMVALISGAHKQITTLLVTFIGATAVTHNHNNAQVLLSSLPSLAHTHLYGA